jgi:hypothetical protein
MSINFEALESHFSVELTRDEMLRISEEITLKFSPDKASLTAIDHRTAAHVTPFPLAALTKPPQIGDFSYQELQAISRDISQRFMSKASNSVPEILLLPVDPHHLYAYWNAGAPQPPLTPDRNLQKPLILRIYWRPNAEQEITRLNLWFEIPADNSANRKKIRLPIDDTNYSAALGRLNPDHSFEALAHSNLVHVPASPGRKRFAAEVSFHEHTAGREQMLSPFDLQEMLDAAKQEGAHFPNVWSMKQHPDNQSSPSSSELAQQYAELMSFFNDYGIDSERLSESGADKPSKQASGLGLF